MGGSCLENGTRNSAIDGCPGGALLSLSLLRGMLWPGEDARRSMV